MQWTVRYFEHKKEAWQRQGMSACADNKMGAAAYAARQSAIWGKMARKADRAFSTNNCNYNSPYV